MARNETDISPEMRKKMKRLSREYNRKYINCNFEEILRLLYFKPQKVIMNGRTVMMTPIEIALRKQREKAKQGDIKAIRFIHEELQKIGGTKSQPHIFIIKTPRPKQAEAKNTQS